MALTTFVDAAVIDAGAINTNFSNEETRDANIRSGFRAGHVVRMNSESTANFGFRIRPRSVITVSNIKAYVSAGTSTAALTIECVETGRVFGGESSLNEVAASGGPGQIDFTLTHEALLPGLTYVLKPTIAGVVKTMTWTGFSPRGRS